MSAKVDSAKFRYELTRRGLTQAQLAKLASVDTNTITHAAQGRRLQQPILHRIALALAAVPPLAVDLLAGAEVAA